jgi:hypothetical protein
MPGELARASARLTARSAGPGAVARFTWPDALPADRLATSAGLLSLAGHPILGDLTDEQRWRLHLREAVQFFSVNVAGERELMAGLAMRLHRGPLAECGDFLQCFLHEENEHSAVFSRFCLQYAGGLYPDRQLRLPRTYAPGEEDFLFFGRVVVFEEITDHFNRTTAADAALCPLVRDIHRYHAEDEARHLAFGHRAVAWLWERAAPGWSAEVRASALGYLRTYAEATLRSYVDPAVYRDAGLPGDPYVLREEALALPDRAALQAAATRRVTRLLDRLEAM